MTRAELEVQHDFNRYQNDVAIDSFMKAIRYQVFKSRELIEGTGGYNIRRGMAHVIAGYCEDLFALYVAKYIGRTDVKYFVDKVIKIQSDNDNLNGKTFKPDLAIIDENNVITHYFDLKTNLGFIRDIKDFLEKKEKFITDLKHEKATITSKTDWLNQKDEHNNIDVTNVLYPVDKSLDIKVNPKLKYHIIVIFGGNLSDNAMAKNIAEADKLNNIKLTILKPTKNKIYDITAFEEIHSSLDEVYKP
ncbi:hypothetical protein [Confluentibacter citreus]|uniref:hypothetical protein n=1 Tax=Confluentibacter citreus TaxID=2007307 RepID=UPI000C28346C|nr:hypothetical protein [Confluentibacter citreus]